ncbi:MAG: PTS sugar transporter subunit IIC [Bacillota bacterium]|nr:PTS sugar transporter subunit IIC [Bacillota bacterium]
MLVKALLLGILAGLAQLDSRIAGDNMLSRPIVTGIIVGLILGDVKTGIIMGGSLELVMMGFVGIGVSAPADVNVGGILGTAFAILSGLDTKTAVALALPVSILAEFFGTFIRTVNIYFQHMADKSADKGDYKGVERSLWYGVVLFFVTPLVVVFIGVMYGSEAAANLVKMIPQQIMDGLSVAAGALPAIGMALLLELTYDKKYAGYLALGFVLASYLKLDSLAIALIGTIIAYIFYQTSKTKEGAL